MRGPDSILDFRQSQRTRQSSILLACIFSDSRLIKVKLQDGFKCNTTLHYLYSTIRSRRLTTPPRLNALARPRNRLRLVPRRPPLRHPRPLPSLATQLLLVSLRIFPQQLPPIPHLNRRTKHPLPPHQIP